MVLEAMHRRSCLIYYTASNQQSTLSMKLRSVLISDAVDPACVQLLEQHGIKVTLRTKMPLNELLAEIKKHDALIVRSDTKVTAEVIAAAPNLKLIGRAGTGVDNIDLDAATMRGVIVMNTPGGNSISACELTCALISSLARNVAPASAALKKGLWERKQFAGTELYGKTLAVLGLGRIGREVAQRMQAFGMRTIGYDPIITKEAASEFNVEKMELEEIWPQADYITVHTPLIPQTRNLINTEVLGRCRRGVCIVNVARGGIVDESALFDAVQSGQCGGAALDVFTEEPPRSIALLELLAHPRVLATPHLGASTAEAQRRVAIEIAEQFVALAQGKNVTGIVNAPIMATALQANNTPWIKLAQYLGCIASQFVDKSALTGLSIVVEAFGVNLAGLNNLSTAVLLGQLAGATENGINLINAPTLARQAGIAIVSTHAMQMPKHLGQHANGLRVKISQPNCQTRSVFGTVRDGVPILEAIDDDVRFPPNGLVLRGNVLLVEARDVNTSFSTLVANVDARLLGVSVARVTGKNSGFVAIHSEEKAQFLNRLSSPDVTILAQQHFA